MGSSPLVSILPLLLVFLVFYFLLVRPQQKRLKAHKEMIESLRRGDVVVTAGGLVGKVVKVRDDSEVEVEIAEGVRIRVVRNMIAEVRVKGEVA